MSVVFEELLRVHFHESAASSAEQLPVDFMVVRPARLRMRLAQRFGENWQPNRRRLR